MRPKDIEFYCTNKGQHDLFRLRSAFGGRGQKYKDSNRGNRALKRDRANGVLHLQVRIRGERMPEGWLDPSKPGGLELNCPKCGRNPQLSEEKLNLLRGAGITELDISRLPF